MAPKQRKAASAFQLYGEGHSETCSHSGLVGELREAYSVTVRYLLSYKQRQWLRIGSREKKQLKALDDPSGRRKKRTQPLERLAMAVDKLPMPACCTCDESSGRLYACLHCVFVGCWSLAHIKQHQAQYNHFLAVDLQYGNVYCALCQDHIYDIEFEHILKAEKSRINFLISRIKEPEVNRSRAFDWTPTAEEHNLITTGATLLPCSGIRGLRNMGSTCFMNVILQSLIHNPLLRTHFLSDRHSSAICQSRMCMACEMDKLFSNFYSGDTTPFGPTSFLHSIWLSHKDLASNQQHDSHEVFISVLNQIHTNCTGQSTHDSNQCNCIIHQVFGGILHSEVTCARCGNVSNTEDPILDISLDLRVVRDKKKKKNQEEEKDAMSLYECLDRFTGVEKLSKEYRCVSCGDSNEAVKQISIKKSPAVLGFQLKRFEHTTTSSNKIETQVSIPFELDLTPYTTRSIKQRSKKSGRKSSLKSFDINDSIPNYKYNLFAVVNHTGKLETGHYTCYAKSRDSWFLFDDHLVTKVEYSEVLNNSKTYMCFYQSEWLDYNQDTVTEQMNCESPSESESYDTGY